ncbi:MAG: TspO/MBR family protein [Pseudomonadota bacterium]
MKANNQPPEWPFIGFVVWLGITFGAALLASAASITAETFYLQLQRPPWAPPTWLFGPVWTVLYLAMGVAAWLVWRTAGLRAAWLALVLYLVQLAINVLWSWVFFVWHQGGAAFAVILLLLGLLLATLVAFWRIQRVAGALFIPYAAWVVFAVLLNFAVWRMNPVLLS